MHPSNMAGWVGVLLLATTVYPAVRFKPTHPVPLSKLSESQNLYSGPWALGPDWSSDYCKGKLLNRYESRCYSEYMAVVTLDALEKLKGEVRKDVEVCMGEDNHFLHEKDIRLEDPDYNTNPGSSKYCDAGIGINTWEERSEWVGQVEQELTKCLMGTGCNPDLFENTMLGPTVFYTKVWDQFFTDFGVSVDDPGTSVVESDFLDPAAINPKPIHAEPYFKDVEPLFSNWQRPSNRPVRPPVNLGQGETFPVFITYNNNKIQVTVNSTTPSGTCVDISGFTFTSEALQVYSQSITVPPCGQKTFEVEKGMGSWDPVKQYWYSETESWDPGWSNWFRTTRSTVRNNFWLLELRFTWQGSGLRDLEYIHLSPPTAAFVKPHVVKPGSKSHIPGINLTLMN